MRKIVSQHVNSSALCASRRGCFWTIGVSGRTQPYARGDLIPKLHTNGGTATSSSDAARMTGTNQNIVYDSDNIFTPVEYMALEGNHYRADCRALSRWAVNPLPEGAAETALSLFNKMEKTNATDKWFAQLFRDYPTFAKAFEGNSLAADLVAFFKSAITVADDEAKVAALAKPVIIEKLEKNFVSLPMWWRVAEALMDQLESLYDRKYDVVNVRVVIERIMKIGMNTVADQPWAHEELTCTKTIQLIGDRVMHEGGLW